MARGRQKGSIARRPLVLGALGMGLGVVASEAHLAWALAALPVIALPERALLAFFLLGFGLASLREPPTSAVSSWAARVEQPVVLDGWVVSAPELRPDAEILTLELFGLMPNPPGPVAPADGRVRVFVPGRGCARAGDRVRVLARLSALGAPLHEGERALLAHQARRGISGFARARHAKHCVRVSPGPSIGFGLLMERARTELHRAIDVHRPDAVGAVVRAFATGDRSGIPRELELAFAESGLSHLLAVSGLNLAIVAGFVLFAWTALFRRVSAVSLGPGVMRTAAFAALPFVVAYTFLVGASASAVRAALMMVIVLLGSCLRRRPDALSSLALACIIMLAMDPWTIFDVSFQLSVAAVWALFQLYPQLRQKLVPGLADRRWLWRAPIEVSLVSLAATLGTAPITALHFGRLSLVGLWVNVPAAPLGSFVLVPLSLLGAATSSLVDGLGKPLLDAACFASQLLIALAEGARALPWASLSLPPVGVASVLLSYAALYAWASGGSLGKRIAWVAVSLAVLSSWVPTVLRQREETLRISFLPVGQGDATLIELPNGRVWLVDVGPPGRDGPGAAERVIIPHLRARRIGAIDAVVLTHPHADHIGGLSALRRAVRVERVIWNGDERETSPALLAPIYEGPNQVVDASAPAYRFGTAELRFVAPSRGPVGTTSVNDHSLVLSITMGRRRILITGDAEAETEQALVDALGGALRADVLKAGHHGSRTSSTQRFLDAVQPKHVVLSLGRANTFGFPHPEVLERLARLELEVWRTDQDGLVRLETDGEQLEIEAYAHPLERGPEATSLNP